MINFNFILLYIRNFIALIGVAVILAGALYALFQCLLLVIGKENSSTSIRLNFGNSVLLGLEFLVGADIIGSIVKPDYYNLGILAILVIVRTLLSYFLNKELKELRLKGG